MGTRFRTSDREEEKRRRWWAIPGGRSSPAKRSANALAPGAGRRPRGSPIRTRSRKREARSGLRQIGGASQAAAAAGGAYRREEGDGAYSGIEDCRKG